MRAQLGLLDHLGIDKLYACIGSSMGGMSSLSMAYLAPERVGRVASISATGRSGLNGVGMRYAQRSGKSSSFTCRNPRLTSQFSWPTPTGTEDSTTTAYRLTTV
jgi:pimeloyl-ACP methyl ester carboxylesterase